MDLPPLIAVVVAVEDPIEGITDIHEGGEREETSGDIDGVTEETTVGLKVNGVEEMRVEVAGEVVVVAVANEEEGTTITKQLELPRHPDMYPIMPCHQTFRLTDELYLES